MDLLDARLPWKATASGPAAPRRCPPPVESTPACCELGGRYVCMGTGCTKTLCQCCSFEAARYFKFSRSLLDCSPLPSCAFFPLFNCLESRPDRLRPLARSPSMPHTRTRSFRSTDPGGKRGVGEGKKRGGGQGVQQNGRRRQRRQRAAQLPPPPPHVEVASFWKVVSARSLAPLFLRRCRLYLARLTPSSSS